MNPPKNPISRRSTRPFPVAAKAIGIGPTPVSYTHLEEELYEEMMDVASSTECTGLMPTPPVTKRETESYSKIYDIPLAKDETVDHMTNHPNT